MTNAVCQPCVPRWTMMYGAMVAPSVAPSVYRPIAVARSRAGNHDDTTFVDPGQFPASPKPRLNRQAPSDIADRASPVSMFEIDHQPTKIVMLTRGPHRSTSRPDRRYAIRYAVR